MVAFKNTITSMITPFDENGGLDIQKLKAELNFQTASGIQGICVLGGTGEYSSLTPEERRAVVEVAAEQRKSAGGSLVVGNFSTNEDAWFESATHALQAGADALMVSPFAHYNCSPRQFSEALQRRSRTLDAPLVIFNTLGRSGKLLSAGDLIELKRKVPSIIGIKDSSGDMAAVARIQHEIGHDTAILQGHDDYYLASRAIGCAGGIVAMASIIPADYAELDEALEKGDLSAAQNIHRKIMSFVDLIESEPMPVAIKAAMKLRGHDVGDVRLPLCTAPEQTVSALRAALATI